MTISKLENLPSELILEISDYLDGCDLYNAFFGLNRRLNTILDRQCHRLHVNFVGISKDKFDEYCHRILPYIRSRIVSLKLCGDNSSTPGQFTLFLTRFSSLSNIFIKLESFQLIDYTKMDVQLLIPQLSTMIHLKCLSIGKYQRLMLFNIQNEELFNENIEFPISLRSLAFPSKIGNRWMETSSNIKESSIELIHIHCIEMNLLFSFLQKFPKLKRLTTVLVMGEDIHLETANMSLNPFQYHTLHCLNINIMYTVSFDLFANFLRNVPQLHSLSIQSLDTEISFFEAHRWEIALPSNLFSFRFDLTMNLSANFGHIELLKAFQNEFWISRGWFVQCHLRDRGRFFRLSTIQSPIINILYWPDDEVLVGSTTTTTTTIYHHVNHIELWWNLSKSTYAICPNVRSIQFYGAKYDNDESIHPNVCDLLQCPSLEHLIINNDLPISERRFGSVLIQSFNNVHKLTCGINWLQRILEDKDNEWICLLITIRIQKLIVIDDQTVLSRQNLINFCRTFINLKELTISLSSIEDFIFLLNTLQQLTMINILLANDILLNITNLTKWIEDNTIIRNFIIHKQSSILNKSKILLWIGSQRVFNSTIIKNISLFNST